MYFLLFKVSSLSDICVEGMGFVWCYLFFLLVCLIFERYLGDLDLYGHNILMKLWNFISVVKPYTKDRVGILVLNSSTASFHLVELAFELKPLCFSGINGAPGITVFSFRKGRLYFQHIYISRQNHCNICFSATVFTNLQMDILLTQYTITQG